MAKADCGWLSVARGLPSPHSLAATDLGTGRTALAITLGHTHSCAILDDKTFKCWGSHGAHLGQASSTAISEPKNADPINLGGDAKYP